jgi:hypothetical protein
MLIYWMMKLKKTSMKKINKKKLKSTGLTRQTCDMDYEIEITTKKINHNKLWNPISNKPSVERWN